MSKQENQKKIEESTSKIITRYERRVQRRLEEQKKELKNRQIAKVMGIVILLAIIALVVSFPIRNYLAIHGAMFYVNDEKVTQQEFDFHYYLALGTYSSYLSYLGVDTSQDLASQQYSDLLTWEDFFQEMAVDSIKLYSGMLAQADEEGFEYDTTNEYQTFVKSVEDGAAAEQISVSDYLKSVYGPYATLDGIGEYVKETMRYSAYYKKISAENAPSEEQITAYYEENRDDYDSVDYRIMETVAVLPTAPTTTSADSDADTDTGTDAETDTGTESSTAYEPTEEEIAAAMAIAKTEADTYLATVATEGEANVNKRKTSIISYYNTWLFDAERKEGDTTVIEDNVNHKYYVLAFEKRYLDQTATADARVIITTAGEGDAVLQEWQAGDLNEATFGSMFEEYSQDALSRPGSGGLVEGINEGDYDEAITTWLLDSERKAADVTLVTTSSELDYILYYVGVNEPTWKIEIEDTLTSETMNAYADAMAASVTVEDPKGNLRFIAMRALESAAQQAESQTQEASQTTEATDTAEASDTTEATDTTETSDTTETTETAATQ
ncbi:MAG: hypothetical protein LBM69_08780 [Lachnospiraceae bacterium]|jgi:hypothetical protein|nr:hypothetical protein [Lachnospiraceae bacterium]